MNKQLGFYSSIIAGGCTVLFLIGLVTFNGPLSYFVCLLLSWAYVLLACAFAQEAEEDKKGIALGGVAIAVIYSVFTNFVYYSQLTTVAHQSASPAVIEAITFTPGSWVFGFDIMGYGLMALSTFLIGLTIRAQTGKERVMKYMFLIHGAFFPVCVLLPMFNVFKQGGESDMSGVIALIFWCIYFAPMMALSTIYFRSRKRDSNPLASAKA
ncbi:hypothetical protein [Paenibacillus brevis]|uniref:Uncharacterized protein n=1 Tax=Paenibacillus brevis TaxID=2841508 RepID=A0ABS6FMV0_9BACL|nr:hypothetical protein [Paenibacillus brevis]MBU5671545.1 hypothetical protein [Paenibacillus brevis]